MRLVRFGLLLVMVTGAQVLAVAAASAQDIICCIEIIGVNGDWFGATRLPNCQDYFDKAPPSILRKMCAQRKALSCINTARCAELPPEAPPAQSPASGGGASLPPNPDRDGLADGFGGPPASPAPPKGGLSPPRLVYLVMGVPGGGKPVTAFTVFLDRAACLLPLAANNQPSDTAAAKHVVRGRIVRGDGRVRIEAEATTLAGATSLGPATGEAAGEDATAVAAATRAALKQMKLVCAR